VAALREDQLRRYARHILLPDIGGTGQRRLLAARVTVVLGREASAEVAALCYLAAAGVGQLQRAGAATAPVQAADLATGILYGVSDLGQPRHRAIARRLLALNPDVQVSLGDGAPGPLTLSLPAAAQAPATAAAGIAEALIAGGSAAARLIATIARRPPPRAPSATEPSA
jgi:molybdopterin/thiamine biosynthesis adenylyltransferase